MHMIIIGSTSWFYVIQFSHTLLCLSKNKKNFSHTLTLTLIKMRFDSIIDTIILKLYHYLVESYIIYGQNSERNLIHVSFLFNVHFFSSVFSWNGYLPSNKGKKNKGRQNLTEISIMWKCYLSNINSISKQS